MVFNSVEFAIYLPIVLLLYAFVCDKHRLRDILLLVCSYIFYMFSYWKYAGLIGFSTIIDYALARRIQDEQDPRLRKLYVVLSIGINLSILATFKYFNFFSDLTTQALSEFGIAVHPWYNELILPAGISFYTFQSLSYTIDVYRKKIDAERDFIKFAAFVAFFPQLVAGPIVRAADFLPQMHKKLRINSDDIGKGLALIVIGLVKKILIADLLALMAVDAVFKNPSAYSAFDLLMTLYGYTFQIYCDFSGYSDIAIGTALLFGFHLPLNFNKPYLSQNPSEFWRRWHISLSSWLRDYLYIPLGGSRGSELFTQRNLMITMLLGGLWHGASAHFVWWGFYQGSLLAIYKMAEKLPPIIPSNALLRRLFFFHLTVFGWLLFRTPNMDVFFTYLKGMASLSTGSSLSVAYFAILLVAAIAHFMPERAMDKFVHLNQMLPIPIKSAAYACLIVLFFGFSIGSSTFIYFQF